MIPPDRAAGAFLAIEGGEGAGKGTIVAALAAQLSAAGFDVLATREPGGTTEGQALRALLLGESGKVWDPWAELLLMTAARVQHVRRLILPAIESGRIVISDRFLGSTLAYQGAGHGLPAAEIQLLHRLAVADLQPDFTLILDIDPRIGVRRSLARLSEQGLDEARFERMDLGFHDRVRGSFLEQAAACPASHAVVDASQPVEQVVEAVSALALQALAAARAPADR